MAVWGFMINTTLGRDYDPEVFQQNINYIKHFKSFFRDAGIKEPLILQFLTEHKLLKENDVDLILEAAEQNDDNQLKAVLLEYQRRIFGPPDPEREFKRQMQALMTGLVPVSEIKKHWSYEKNSTGVTITKYLGFQKTADIPAMVGKSTVTALKPEIFRGNETIEAIGLPYTLTDLGSAAFAGCINLRTVNIPHDITKIPSGTFHLCKSLSEITIPSKVTVIDSFAFAYCESLTRIEIPEGVTTLGSFSFCNCPNLREITLPASVTAIQRAFSESDNLTIKAPKGSFAESYAMQNDIPCITY